MLVQTVHRLQSQVLGLGRVTDHALEQAVDGSPMLLEMPLEGFS